jgi:hypothetical protein
LRGIVLIGQAALHHGDFVAQGHGFNLIVGDLDNGGAQTLVQQLDFAAYVDAQFGI